MKKNQNCSMNSNSNNNYNNNKNFKKKKLTCNNGELNLLSLVDLNISLHYLKIILKNLITN